jgi:hypothetical protein
MVATEEIIETNQSITDNKKFRKEQDFEKKGK